MSGCLLCGSEGRVLLFKTSDRLYGTTAREFAVVRCAQCGFARLDPQPGPAELRGYYPENYWFAPDESAAGRFEELYRRLAIAGHVRFVEQALRHSKARGPVLDVGAGGGLLLGRMREHGFRVVALDISREAAAIAWSRQRVPSVCGMLERAPLDPGRFAGVTMFHVLEHVPDPRAYLIAARNLLAPDGRLVVQVPNAACWQFRLLGPRWNGVDVPRHLFDFRERDLEALVESCGFEVVRRRHFSLRDNPAGLATSLAPGLEPVARRARHVPEPGVGRLAKDFVYLALVLAALPFTLAEAACHAGSTIMIEARRR
jgi:SAM-dependent methyltransferase